MLVMSTRSHKVKVGKQGDPLMPMLFCIGQHLALAAVAQNLREGERLFAYLDDLYHLPTGWETFTSSRFRTATSGGIRNTRRHRLAR